MSTLGNNAGTAVVLVHGGFVDGSGWEDVYKLLRRSGYPVQEVKGSHAVYVSQPSAVASLIEKAARSVAVTAK